jgi:glycerol-3-phosphate dehydrogenase (NAD(P)+)
LNIPNPENYNPKIKTIAVLGSGSWATALVKIFTDSGIHVHWYLRKKDDVDFIKKHLHNKNYLTDVKFNPSDITLSSELSTVIKQVDCFGHTFCLSRRNFRKNKNSTK